ncbi:MAG: BatA and WFA domain-containing protein [Verrucomicrobium sp.]|nr:BatA and WFA domain-containing protein [Verrucomicrobium sp.]
MPFLFTQAFLLSALAGLGIPVLLHLLLRQRNPRKRFSTLRFFEVQDTRSSARRRLRNLWLLLLRLVVFALIVLAFARPYLPDGWNGTPRRPRRDVVILLDRSLSLRAREGATPRWTSALAAANRILDGLAEGDRAALVSVGERAEVLSGFAPPDRVRGLLQGLAPGAGRGDLAGGFREALDLVGGLEAPGSASVEVIGDLQRSGADGLATVPLPRWLPVGWTRVGSAAVPPNVAVTDLRPSAGDPGALSITLANLGDTPVNDRIARCLVDGKAVAEIPFSRAAGQSATVEWRPPRPTPGWHEIEVRLTAPDALADDDVRRLTLQVPEPVRVAVVENRSGVRSFEEQGFFLAAALDPFLGGTNAGRNGFIVEVLRPEALAGVLGRNGGLPAPRVVLLPAQRALPAPAVAALGAWVEQGGGLLLFGGEDLEPSRFNAEFGGLTPARPGAPVASAAEVPWRIGAFDRDSPVFRPFGRARAGGPSVAEFTRRHALEAVPGATVLARFDDTRPFLLARSAGAGRVLFANTSADTAWTDWPKHKSFVPWVHASVSWLADGGAERRPHAPEPLMTGTGAAIAPAGDGDPGLQPVLSVSPTPEGPVPEVSLRADGTAVFEVPHAGIYRLADPAGTERWRRAANPPPVESDLAALDASAAAGLLARRTDAESDLPPGWFGNEPGRREWWRLLMGAALAVLLIETVVANRSTP